MVGSLPKIIILLLFLCCVGATAQAGELLGTVGFSKFLDARVGVEYYVTPRWGIKTDVGLSLVLSDFPDVFIFTYDLLGVFVITEPEGVFILKALAGVIDGHLFTFCPPIVTVAPGCSLWMGAMLGKRFDVGLRLGTGALFQYENYTFDTSWWYDLVLEIHYHFQ